MIKSKKSVVLLLLVLIGLSGCFEFRLPEISPIVPPKVEVGPYEFYVASMTITFDTLLNIIGDALPLDEFRETYPDDPSGETDWFVQRFSFNQDMPPLDMGLEVDAVSSSISQSMEFVEFSTRNFNLSEPIELQDVIDLSLLPDGTPVPIDSLVIDPDTSYANFPMDRQRFSSGTLSVTLQNDYQCYLGIPISITVYDSLTGAPIDDGTGDTLRLLWDTHVAPGESSEKQASLVGVEFPSTIMIITEGVICGSGHDTVLTVSDEMKTSSFSASGSISGLVGDFVEGDLDPQVLNDTSVISFGDDLNDPNLSVDKVYLDISHVKISITNTSSVSGKMMLNLMSLDTSSVAGIQYFSTDSLVIPSENSAQYTFDLNTASIDLTSDFEYRTYINIPGQYGQLEASDEFEISFEFYGDTPGDPIGIESVDATFSNMEYVIDNASIDIGDMTEMLDQFGDIELSSIEMSVDINSSISIPMTLDLNLIGVKNGGADSLIISKTQQITGTGGNPHLVFTGAADLINFKPDSMIFNGSVLLDGSGNLALVQEISIDGDVVVPFEFVINEPITFPAQYSRFGLPDLFPFLNDFTGSIKAAVDNTYQFGISFAMLTASDTNYFNNAAYEDCVKTFIELTIPALDTTTQTIVLTKEDYDYYVREDSLWMFMDIQMSGRTDGQPTTFLTTDYVIMDLTIEADGTLDLNELDFGSPDTTGNDTTGGVQ